MKKFWVFMIAVLCFAENSYSQLHLVAKVTEPSCKTQNSYNDYIGNGVINLTAIGGTPPYTYSMLGDAYSEPRTQTLYIDEFYN